MSPSRIIYVTITCFLCICLVTSQDFLESFGGQREELSRTQARDPRDNRGPVLFPPSAMAVGSETSGVRVGASGYGFVPPSLPKGLGSGPSFLDFFHGRRR